MKIRPERGLVVVIATFCVMQLLTIFYRDDVFTRKVRHEPDVDFIQVFQTSGYPEGSRGDEQNSKDDQRVEPMKVQTKLLPFAKTYQASKGSRDIARQIRKTQRNSAGPRNKSSGENYPPLLYNAEAFVAQADLNMTCSAQRRKKGFLTIGIPTVRRPNTDTVYLFDTLNSLSANTRDPEQEEVVVVVLLSDFNETYNQFLAEEIPRRYEKQCQAGFIRVIKTVPYIYPDLSNIAPTFNDPKQRVIWRSKQNVDFAYLMLYSAGLSDYYIQIEDDVVVAKDYISYIRNFTEKQKPGWFLLEFSQLGFIGKFFKSSDLERVAYYLLSFFDKMPGDLLLGHIRDTMLQKKAIHSPVSVFQHLGWFSSLENKMMPSIDKTFKDAASVRLPMASVPKGDNPSAKIETNFQTYETYLKENAYDNTEKYFWATAPPKGAHFSVIFQVPHNLSRIVIVGGDSKTRKDTLRNGDLHVAVTSADKITGYTQPASTKECGAFKKLGELVDGHFDSQAQGYPIPSNVVCLKIVVSKQQRTWVIIRNIAVML